MTGILARAVLAASGSIDVSIVVKATLVLGLPLLGLRYARGARASVRHAILAATYGVLLILPVAAVVLPRVVVGIPIAQVSDSIAPLPVTQQHGAAVPAAIVHAPSAVASQSHRSQPSRTWPATSTLFRAGWLAGTLLLLLPLAVPLWRLRGVRCRGLPWLAGEDLVHRLAAHAGIRRSIDVLLHEDAIVPVTYGVTRPVILLPMDAQEWGDGEIRPAIVHELEHVRRGDWPVTLAARIVCAMYWFHPLAWVALRALCLESERACDDAVLREADHTTYADQLLRLAERLSNGIAHPVLSMANRSDLSARIGAVLNRDQRRGRPSVVSATVIAAVAVAVVLALAPLAAVGRVTDSHVRLAAHQLSASANVPLADAAPPAFDAAPLRQVLTVQTPAPLTLAEPTPIVQVPAAQAPQPLPAPAAPPAPTRSVSDSYVVAPTDTLSITVDDGQLNYKLRVDESGMATIPYIGRIPAGGQTILQLQDDLTKRIAASLARNAQVWVDVEQPKRQTVNVTGAIYVTGAVRTPTAIQMQGTSLTLLAALVQAGSPAPDAADEVRISHKQNPNGAPSPDQADSAVLSVKLRDLNLGAGNIALRDGDIVFVPTAKHFTVTGQVRNNGSYVWEAGMTVEKAIARAGGTTDRASIRGMVARRLVDGKMTDVVVTMDDEVLADDVIRVGSRIF